MNPFQKRLKAIDGTWRMVKADQDKPFEKMKDGKYLFRLMRAEIGESRNAENPRLQVAWECRVLKGPQINKRSTAFDGIESERGQAAIKGRLVVLGIKPPKRASDLPEALDLACDRKFWGRLKSRGAFQNFIFLRRVKGKEKPKKSSKKKEVDQASEGL